MAYLEGCVGGTDNPRLVYTYQGVTTDWDSVPVPSILAPKWQPRGERITLLDGTEIDINKEYRFTWVVTYVYLVRADEIQFQEAAQSTQVLFYPHKDNGMCFEVLVDLPWIRKWAADKAVGHANVIRMRETTLRRTVSEVGEALAASGGSSWGRP